MRIRQAHYISLIALSVASAAYGQTAPTTPRNIATPKQIADTTVAADAVVEEVIVYGRGQTNQTQTVSHDQILSFAPGTSPIKAVAKLPSVNFESADPFGSYEWAERISIRGFPQNFLGYTLDDVPLGDMSYANDNGLHISRAISSENIGQVKLAQGTGGLDTASTSNLGGTLKFISRNPADTFGGDVAITYGSENTTHDFLRIDTGELPGGGKGYVSYGYQRADKWKGDGIQYQHQANAKFIQPITDDLKFTGFINFSDRHENDYQDLSLDLIRRDGYQLDNVSNNFALAKTLAEVGSNSGYTGVGITYPGVGTSYPAPFTTADDAYYDAGGNRTDWLDGGRFDWAPTDNLALHATGYSHNNRGMGTWFTPYVATPAALGGSPIALRTTEYSIQREGVVSSADYDLTDTLGIGTNKIKVSFWYENNDFDQARRFYAVGLDSPGRSAIEFQNNPFATQWQYAFNTNTYVGSIQDDWNIRDNLKVNFGFKGVDVENNARTVFSSPSIFLNGSISTSKAFLPQIGANYMLDDVNEFFADYAENVRAFVSSHTDGPFSTTQAGFNAIQGNLKPETSDTYEIGYRFHLPTLEGVASGYYVNFHDRLLATTVGAGIVGNPSALANVGGVTSQGIELAATWKFIHNWSLFGSYSYNRSTYDSNTYNGQGVLTAATQGKTTVDAPRNIGHVELGYDDNAAYGAITANYIGSRYYTYTNNGGRVPDYVATDFNVGYHIQNTNSWLDGFDVQFNITNIFDKKYISTIGTNGFVNSDPSGSFQTLMVSSPREEFFTLRKKF